MDPVIAFRGFGFSYANSKSGWAVRDVTLDIPGGSLVVITGGSGSGKTTLVSAINGIVPHLQEGEFIGEVSVCGLDVRAHPVATLAGRVGMVFQDPEVQLFTLTVEDEVAMSLECHGVERSEMRSRVDWAINTCGLKGLEMAAPARLSGGQKQRVAIASVIAREPDVLVLDDPTANLDPEGAASVFATVRSISKLSGKTTVLVVRDPSPLMGIADHLVVLKEGALFAQGEPSTLLKDTEVLRRCGLRIPPRIDFTEKFSKARGAGAGWKTDQSTSLAGLPPVLASTTRSQSRAAKLEGASLTERALCSNTNGEIAAIPAVTFRDVTFTYGGPKAALTDVNLTVLPGEFLAICGENGAGKTTLVHHILGLVRPTSGTVEVAGEDVSSATVAKVAQMVGLIFQNPNHQLFRDTVTDEVGFGPRCLGWESERVQKAVLEALEAAGISGLGDLEPDQLSMGQKQRVAIASVLALHPSILLLDEPTTGQDQAAVEKLMDLVKALNRDGVTVLMITHDMELVLEHARRMIVLIRGQLVADGLPSAILRERDLITSAGLLSPDLLTLSDEVLAEAGLDADADVRTTDDLVQLLMSPLAEVGKSSAC